ncbi:hypothetical protein [Arenibaculum pallidiluteum]|uniref:hypothetical protein n=1 Tax=Arenibaculum pallidiluteum TaxID=2812559 RepID=UPI001A97CA8F|nr:hypothetical protein [Arenibaculum pallidiluteum]
MEQPGDTAGDGAIAPGLMRGVKIAMAVMGVLILAGFAFIGFEIYHRATDPEYRAGLDERGRTVRPEAALREGGAYLLPAGAEIVAAVPVGNRLAVTVRHADGTQSLLFVHPGTDEIVEALRTQPARR